MKDSIYKVKIISLLLFIFSLPFEYWDPWGIAGFFTVTKIAAAIYFVLSIFDIKSNFKLKETKIPVLALFTVWIFISFRNVFTDRHGIDGANFDLSFLQSILLFWLLSNDILRRPRLLKPIFSSLIAGVFLAGVLVSFGVGIDSAKGSDLGSYRLYFFGLNPNKAGDLAATALILTIHMLISKEKYFGKKTYLLILVIPSILSLIGFSGSRGSLLIVFIGTILLFVFHRTTFKNKLILIFAGIMFTLIAASVIFESDIMTRRFQQSIEEGSVGGRDIIWKEALDIFYENPIIGVGRSGYFNEMKLRLNNQPVTHNIFLHIMVRGGIIALIPYLIFIFFLTKSANSSFVRQKEIIMYVLLFVFIFIVSKTGEAIKVKLAWLIASIIFGSGFSLKSSLKRNNIIKKKRI